MAILTLAATAIAVVAIRNADNAAEQHAVALSRQLAADSLNLSSTDAFTARQLAVAAYRVYPTTQASSAMATLLTQEQEGTIFVADGVVTGVVFSPDSKLMATIDDVSGTVRLWNPATGQPVGHPLPTKSSAHNIPTGIAFSPDGKLLAVGNTDGIAQLWNVATGKVIWSLRANTSNSVPGIHSMGVNTVAFSPDGKLLVTGDGNGDARLWNPATGQPVGPPLPAGSNANGGVNSAAFSSNGKLLVTDDGDGTVRLWNPATGQPIGHPLNPGGDALQVALSTDGKTLAVNNFSGNITLWSLGDPAQPRELTKHYSVGGTNSPGPLAFSPDGKLLAAANN